MIDVNDFMALSPVTVPRVGFTNSIALEIGQIHAPDRIYEPYGFEPVFPDRRSPV